MPSVTVLDMQVIDPPVGGGRLRLLGLYHGFPEGMPVLYVGTYDWPREFAREQKLSSSLTERLVPLTDEHFAAARMLSAQVGGRTVIDSAFHLQAHLSPEFLAAARAAAAAADVVVYSHPWLYPLTADVLDRERQLVVYDAHNVEGKLRTQLLDDGAEGTRVAREVVRVEWSLCRAADLVLCCSQDDAQNFNRLYGMPMERMRVVPNGVFTTRIRPADAVGRASARTALKLSDVPAAIFLGSSYPPNVEAARYMIQKLAPALPEVAFIIAGGVGQDLRGMSLPQNVRVTGFISEEEKLLWLAAVDMAVNPMFSGSGTNIKMLDFMAAGLPVISTPVGARGIVTSTPAFDIAEGGAPLIEAIRRYVADGGLRVDLGRVARAQAERYYSWERISAGLGIVLQNHWKRLSRRRVISVVVPSYERHSKLSALMMQLGAQRFRDFEVIVVDQSAELWHDRDRDFGFDLLYIHSEVKGAVAARNTGAAASTGSIIAFTDDDCSPDSGWLEAAVRAFGDPLIAGLEGLVISDRLDDPDWRPVTNHGFEGMGFMTANLFIRAEVFHALGGFDIAFENPHFREDTDLGWRALAFGRIPFSHEAWVYHPPHPRAVERESLATRSAFFVNDARLWRKHPERFVALFHAEAQWRSNPFYWTTLLEGFRREGLALPPQIRAAFEADRSGGAPAGDPGILPHNTPSCRPTRHCLITQITSIKREKYNMTECKFEFDWFSPNIPSFDKHLKHLRGTPCALLEIGCHEGRSSTWLLQNIASNEAARLLCIDLYEQPSFWANIKAAQGGGES